MNRLVDALLARPQVIDVGTQERTASFSLLMERLGDTLFSGPERDHIAHDAGLRGPLGAGYLPTITAPDWDGALTLAEDDDAAALGWWTVMVPASTGSVGLTIPQDSSTIELVALFTGPPDSARTLVYDPAAGSLVDLSPQAHCAPPSRGRCGPGLCGGCTPHRVWSKATGYGIKCRCQDQVT